MVKRIWAMIFGTLAQAIRDPRLVIHNFVKRDPLTGLAEDVRKGLSALPKRFLPKYFYDELGSQLFEAICLLRSEEHTSELQSLAYLVCRLLLEKKNV